MNDSYNDPSVNKVLVVDDDALVLAALKEQLPPMGFHVTTVDSDTLAREHLKAEIFGIILIVAGAIVTFAVDTAVEGVDWNSAEKWGMEPGGKRRRDVNP